MFKSGILPLNETKSTALIMKSLILMIIPLELKCFFAGLS